MTDYRIEALGTQYTAMYSIEDEFIDHYSSARTFCFFSEILPLKEADLIKGGSIDNALVFLDREIHIDEVEKIRKLFAENVFENKLSTETFEKITHCSKNEFQENCQKFVFEKQFRKPTSKNNFETNIQIYL